MVGPAKINAINSIFDEGLSCETFREREAGRLMNLGTYNFNIKKQERMKQRLAVHRSLIHIFMCIYIFY